MSYFSGRSSKIAGTGKYLPGRVMTNFDFEKILDTNDEWIVERTGIKKRHFDEKGQQCSDIAYFAALEALKDAKISASEIDMILVGTNSPESMFPSVASKIQDRLGAKRAGAMDIHAGCTANLSAMAVGVSGIASGMWNNVLVVGAEAFGEILDWSDRGTCILMGDGAGACVLTVSDEDGPCFVSSKFISDGSKHDILAYASAREGEPKTFQMKGHEVFKYVNKELPPFISSFCEQSGILPEQVDLWVLHQANTRIIDSVFKRVGISTERTLLNLERYGNTSAASIMIALDESMKAGLIKSGQRICFIAFGAGMTIGGMLYEA